MYTPGFGSCSSLIHLLAKHPKIILGAGVLAVTSYLVSPVGPGVHLGSKGILAKQESRIRAGGTLEAVSTFQEVECAELSDASIRYILDKTCECKDISPDDVRSDPILKHNVGLLYFFDLCSKHGIEKAKVLYLNQ